MNGLQRARAGAATWAGVGLLLLATGAQAQVLSSPLGGAAPARPAPGGAVPSPSAPAGTATQLPHGQGAGVHSPLSPFAPMRPRSDVVAWSVITDVQTVIRNRRIVPTFPAAVTRLNQKTLRLQGFMMPLGPGEQQRHFLLASVPLTCAFCVPGGPESMVEVRTRTPVKYEMNAVVVEGRFHVLENDPQGLYYRLTEAVGVR